MKKIVFDIETKNIQSDGGFDPEKMDVSLVCTYDYETDSYGSFFEDDLPKLWPLLEEADMLIGFNSDYFDIPILNRYYHGDLRKIKSLDIMQEMKKVIGRRVSLNQIAEGTLGKKKSGHGLQAIEWWKKGDLESLKKYCLDDVKITREIYDFARSNNKLKYAFGGIIEEVKIDTSSWEKDVKSSMTFSLPF